ncbi:MAG TPA: transcriptional regulator [Gammaproteobacteria bacterium]|nr:transcriptional regulator [Gammaproteobacteria bacterium]
MVKRKKNIRKTNKLTKIINERHYIDLKKGELLQLQVWEDDNHNIVKYDLVYINPLIYAGDNGRVLAYDNNHDIHHKHYFGEFIEVDFVSYEDQLEKFEQEYEALKDKFKA